MNVELTPDQRAFVQRAIEILAALDEASLARGEGIPITEESMKALAEDVKQRGRRRLAVEGTTSR